MKKLIGAMLVLSFMTVGAPAFAAEGATVNKTLGYIEFSQLPGNHGLDQKLIQRRYTEYRNGRLPVSTLDTSSMR